LPTFQLCSLKQGGADLTHLLGQEMFCGHRLHAVGLPKPDQGCAPIPKKLIGD